MVVIITRKSGEELTYTVTGTGTVEMTVEVLVELLRMAGVKREIPLEIQDGLRPVLQEEAWERWMDTKIWALGDRTPWEVIDAGDIDRVKKLLISYVDGVWW